MNLRKLPCECVHKFVDKTHAKDKEKHKYVNDDLNRSPMGLASFPSPSRMEAQTNISAKVARFVAKSPSAVTFHARQL